MTFDHKEELVEKIREAFWQSSSPDVPEHFDAESEASEDFSHIARKDWESLNIEDFKRNSWALASLPIELFPYYLGAYLELSARKMDFEVSAFDYLITDISGEKWGKRFNRRIVFDFRSRLSEKQLSVLREYLYLRAAAPEEPERLRLRRVADDLAVK